MMDSTVPCDLPIDNLVPDVLVVATAGDGRSSHCHVRSGVGRISKGATTAEDFFSNLMDHMACEGQLQDLERLLRKMTTRDAARNEVSRLLHQIATAMERRAEKLRTQMAT